MSPARKILFWTFTAASLSVTAWATISAWHAHADFLKQEYRTRVLSDMIATTDFGFVVLDPDGYIVEWGPGAEKTFGWSAHEVLGSKPDFLMPAEYRQAHALAINRERFDYSRNLVEVNGWAYHKDGRLIPVHIVVASFQNHHGYYHAAMFSPGNDVVRHQAERPTGKAKLAKPEPSQQYLQSRD